MFGIVAGPSDPKWRWFHNQARVRNLHTKFQLNRLKYIQIRAKHVFGVVASPSDSKWHQFHIQARLRNLHTKFQLNLLKYSRIRAKTRVWRSCRPLEFKMASVPYSGTTKEPTYQISAYLVKIQSNLTKNTCLA